MSINSTIKAAVVPIVPICVPHLYAGTEKEYCTFNYTMYPTDFGDNAPGVIGYSVQLHYCLPLNDSPLAKLKLLSDALFSAGFDYPQIVDVTDKKGQHYVLESGWHEVMV
ncbi:hypothetical protein KQI82_12390 [Oscillibacter sp. MSJ-2]|uniref:Uncharacterized protein n=1 Tax=Dysosmobacter acutus TaxID=2841504 RepID=A0ABS6FBP9_9FIRM|nr:hypothetical protein [Dysosmobacter acutus]MBU5627708.1 hypothetical protein [Dysosmobacter acutus]